MNLETVRTVQPVEDPNRAFARLASDEQIERAVKSLGKNGIQAYLVEKGSDVKEKLEELIPAGAEVFTSSSTTLRQLGLLDELDQTGRFEALRARLGKMDPKTQNRDMQKLGATPEYIVGSVHAVTESGSVLVASATGSQLAPYAASAAHVIWVVGAQKIVPSLDEALQRLEEYTFPLEDQRAMKAYGAHSGINKMLVINKEINPDRTRMIIVKEVLGF
jgi:L-lactate utilization protein LutC